jgi:ribonuclease R
VELHHGDNKRGKTFKGTVSAVIGKCGEIENDLNAVIQEYELEPPYSEEDNKKAATLQALEIKREDFTDRFCVTVDPVDAKDRDDAVSLKKLDENNQWELGVHIADVAAWIRPGSKWDKEAAKRSFTSYLPGKTLPMLPKSLTKLISLNDGADCPAHSVIMTVDGESGEIVSSRRCHSIIRVASNLNFEQIDNYIDGKPDKEWDAGFADNIGKWIELVRKMREFRRKREKFLELATVDIRVLCDDETKEIQGIKKEIQTEADTMIEDCMLAANTEVAIELINKTIPGMFRVHAEPDPEKVEEFSSFVHDAFGIFPGDLTSREACNAFLKSLPDDHKKPVIINSFLRTMPRALYSEENSIHFGLGKMRYSHFTSPIRRYPDLIVHQQLWAADCNDRMKSKKSIEKIAASCSLKEANNDEAYYAANDRLKLHYMQSLMDGDKSPMHEAVITKVTSSGFLVDVTDLGVFGWVDRDSLGGLYRKKGAKYISIKGHQEFCCGNFIYVRLESIDLVRGRAIFRPVI